MQTVLVNRFWLALGWLSLCLSAAVFHIAAVSLDALTYTWADTNFHMPWVSVLLMAVGPWVYLVPLAAGGWVLMRHAGRDPRPEATATVGFLFLAAAILCWTLFFGFSIPLTSFSATVGPA